MRILGVDPGLRATGYAVLQGSPRGIRLIRTGVIRTDDAAALSPRLRAIYTALAAVIEEYRPDGLAVEDLFAARRFPRTAILMGHVRGVVCLAAAERGIAVDALPPAAVKSAIAGFGGASKTQIQQAVRRLLGKDLAATSHAADAAAMALVVLSRRGVPLAKEAAG
ncbi:MAG TPA: crossover junction endodeoxyribonuclease RuvC [bacterium]|nr:crossover junction endodeoxyribonuclease RuvC [bacterium]